MINKKIIQQALLLITIYAGSRFDIIKPKPIELCQKKYANITKEEAISALQKDCTEMAKLSEYLHKDPEIINEAIKHYCALG